MKNSVYLFPFNDIAINLSNDDNFLKDNDVLGFIDNSKKNSILVKDIINTDFDLIIICSPNYYIEINNELLNYKISKNKIKFYVNSVNKIIDHIDQFEFYYNNNIKDYEPIKKLKNKHSGERIFLIGNGPSLDIKDLDLLKNEITFASNKIYLAYSKTSWRPTYYLVEDDLVYNQNYNEINNLKGSLKLFPQYSLSWNKRVEDALYFNLRYLPDDKEFPSFNPDPITGMYWGSTVIYTMIQWAVYLGCKEIYLLGVDFSFKEPKSYVINDDKRKDLICEGEVNHFHKDYRKIGEKWNLPNLDVQKQSFFKAKKCTKNLKISIFNTSRETKLNIFEKMLFDDVFKENDE